MAEIMLKKIVEKSDTDVNVDFIHEATEDQYSIWKNGETGFYWPERLNSDKDFDKLVF